jgi:hypothetical protein
MGGIKAVWTKVGVAIDVVFLSLVVALKTARATKASAARDAPTRLRRLGVVILLDLVTECASVYRSDPYYPLDTLTGVYLTP